MRSHPAAHLRGDADRVPVMIPHENRFDAVAVCQLPQVFHSAVLPGKLLACRLGDTDEALRLQLFPQGFWQVGHLLKRLRPPMAAR